MVQLTAAAERGLGLPLRHRALARQHPAHQFQPQQVAEGGQHRGGVLPVTGQQRRGGQPDLLAVLLTAGQRHGVARRVSSDSAQRSTGTGTA